MPDFLVCFLRNIYLNFIKKNSNSQNMLEKITLRIAHIKELCSMVDLFIAPSQFLRRRFFQFGIPEYKMQFISHGINIESFSNFKRKLSDRIRFGFIGTILPAKGVDILIKAFNHFKDKKVDLKIYGNLFPYKGFEYYPKHIRRLVENENIRFMGRFNHNDVSNVFSEIDILILPSIWNENCPLTILEAFITKTPIIASKIGGIPELASDGVNGLLFTPGDVNDLQEKIQFIINNPDAIEKFMKNTPVGKNIEENAKEMEEIYSKLVAKRKV